MIMYNRYIWDLFLTTEKGDVKIASIKANTYFDALLECSSYMAQYRLSLISSVREHELSRTYCLTFMQDATTIRGKLVERSNDEIQSDTHTESIGYCH